MVNKLILSVRAWGDDEICMIALSYKYPNRIINTTSFWRYTYNSV